MNWVSSWGGRIAAMVGNRGGPWGGSGGSGGSGGGGDSGSGGGSGDGSGGGGKGPRSPWGRPGPRRDRPEGSSGGGSVTSFDDWLKRSRDRIRGGIPGGGGGGASGPRRNWVIYGIIGFIILWVLFTSIHAVPPGSRGVVTTFGRYERTMNPGVGFTFPSPISQVQTVPVEEIRTIDIPSGNNEENLILTGDQNVIDLAYSVSWNISDPQLFLFQIRDPEQTIREVAESSMRSVVSRISLTDALGAGRGEIASRVQQNMQELLNEYGSGIQITNIAVKQSQPPEAVNAAFLEVTAAAQKAQSAQNDARAYALQLTARAEGDAAQFEQIYQQYRLAPEVTRRRMYYEMMEDVLARVQSTIVEAPGVTPYLALPEIQRRSQQQQQRPAATPAQPAQQGQQGQAQPAQPAQGQAR